MTNRRSEDKLNLSNTNDLFGCDGKIRIAVIGVGGGGGNAVQYMTGMNGEQAISGVEFMVANTDLQALQRCPVATVPIGKQLTKGMGSGGNPAVGKEAAKEDATDIQNALSGIDILFIAAGLGGGTGSGAAPAIAEIAHSLGILTIGVVTKPFHFEGAQRMKIAEFAIEELIKSVDSLIVVPNNKLLSFLDKDATLLDAFQAANAVLANAVQGISDLITNPGLINVDFADLHSVIKDMGPSVMSVASATGDLRAKDATLKAISSPLLSDTDLEHAKGILVNVTAGLNLKLSEFQVVGDLLSEYMSEKTHVVMGTSIDPDLVDELRVTVIITGAANKKGAPKASDARTAMESSVKNNDIRHNLSSSDKDKEVPAFLRRKMNS